MKTNFKMIGTFFFVIGGIYLLVLVLMFTFQDQLLFLPSSHVHQTPQSAGIAGEDVWFETEDGVTLHGWYLPNEESDVVILFSHGNAGNISMRLDLARALLESGASVFLYDYRGYGKSEGTPNEEGLYKDVAAAVRALRDDMGYPEEKIVFFGRSLGAAVAASAIVEFNPGGLVLDSAFKNLKSMVRQIYPFVPSGLARYEFPTDRFLQHQDSLPVMIFHSRDDEIIGFHHGEELYEQLNQPKIFVELQGSHNDNFYLSRDLYEASWREFLQGVESGL